MKVHELINSPEKWTKGAYARNVDGNESSLKDPEAARWCTLGGILKCYDNDEQERREVEIKLATRIGRESIAQWNDSSTFEEVHAVLKELDI